MKSVSASHLQYNRWNSLLPKGLAKLWIFNFNISMNIMNCFSKTKFSLLFHPIFLSFAVFGMFHFRNSKFLNDTGTSNKTSNFPNIFFRFRFLLRSGCPWRKAVSLAPRMRPSLGCLAASKQHPNNIHIQHPNPKKNTPHCEVKLLPCRVSKQRVQLLWQKSWYFYHRKHRNMSSGWSFPDQFTAVSKTSMKLP